MLHNVRLKDRLNSVNRYQKRGKKKNTFQGRDVAQTFVTKSSVCKVNIHLGFCRDIHFR